MVKSNEGKYEDINHNLNFKYPLLTIEPVIHVDVRFKVCEIGNKCLRLTKTKDLQPKEPEQKAATRNWLCPTPSPTNPSRLALPLFFCSGFFFFFL